MNYNWNFITENYDISAGLTLNDNDESVDLDANYSVSAVDEHSISLANATTINDDWEKIPTLFNGSTAGLNTSEIYLEIVANKWVELCHHFDQLRIDCPALMMFRLDKRLDHQFYPLIFHKI